MLLTSPTSQEDYVNFLRMELLVKSSTIDWAVDVAQNIEIFCTTIAVNGLNKLLSRGTKYLNSKRGIEVVNSRTRVLKSRNVWRTDLLSQKMLRRDSLTLWTCDATHQWVLHVPDCINLARLTKLALQIKRNAWNQFMLPHLFTLKQLLYCTWKVPLEYKYMNYWLDVQYAKLMKIWKCEAVVRYS